ncbi:MAG: hypothetical protein ACR2F1_07215 [Nitrososphaeraceae archaeon]
MAENNIIVSAVANMELFLSSHILAILPAFISYLSRTILHEIRNITDRKISLYNRNIEFTTINNSNKKNLSLQKSVRINIFLNVIYFVLGFSLVFAALKVAFNRTLVNVRPDFQNTLQIIWGIENVSVGGLSKDSSNNEKFVIDGQRVYNLVKTNNMENKRSKLVFKENNFKSTHLHLVNWSIL